MSVCLVTGGAGFVGSHLVQALVARGDRVRVLDNFTSGTLSNLDPVRNDIEVVLGDVENAELLQKATDGAEFVFHLAFPPMVGQDPARLLDVKWASATETLQVLIAAQAAGVRRFIYASSIAVYGHADRVRFHEEDIAFPNSSYGFAKLAGEMQCLGFASLHGLETVRLRYSNTFGPRQAAASGYARELPAIVQTMLAGQRPVLDEAAVVARDFIDIDDVVHATLLAAHTPRVSGQVYNIARGRSVNLLEVVETLNGLLGTFIEPIRQGPDFGPVSAATVDIGKAEKQLGFCPSIDLRQGLLKLIEFIQRDTPAPDEHPKGPHFRGARSSQPVSGKDAGDVEI